eukprot:NODE_348_length_8996_cov_0.416433.p7 type:complete len:136 gc:universal NODE_348_length_8996_cov_0.416433:6618-6211(-)
MSWDSIDSNMITRAWIRSDCLPEATKVLNIQQILINEDSNAILKAANTTLFDKMGLQRQQFINITNNLPLPPIEFLPISPNLPATMTESTEEMDRELGLNHINTLFGGNLVLILGMMISNIDEIDRINNNNNRIY